MNQLPRWNGKKFEVSESPNLAVSFTVADAVMASIERRKVMADKHGRVKHLFVDGEPVAEDQQFMSPDTIRRWRQMKGNSWRN
jgi:hypothetical protein